MINFIKINFKQYLNILLKSSYDYTLYNIMIFNITFMIHEQLYIIITWNTAMSFEIYYFVLKFPPSMIL